jgi:hypothetical protein
MNHRPARCAAGRGPETLVAHGSRRTRQAPRSQRSTGPSARSRARWPGCPCRTDRAPRSTILRPELLVRALRAVAPVEVRHAFTVAELRQLTGADQISISPIHPLPRTRRSSRRCSGQRRPLGAASGTGSACPSGRGDIEIGGAEWPRLEIAASPMRPVRPGARRSPIKKPLHAPSSSCHSMSSRWSSGPLPR